MSKSNYFKGLCVALAMVFAGLGAQAQQLELSGYFNGMLPVAEFNDDVTVMMGDQFTPINLSGIGKGASAGIGGSLRVGLWLDVGANNWLLPYFEGSFLWNSTKSKYRDVYDNNSLNAELKSTPSVPNYFNIPLLVGVKYRYDLTDIIRPFAEMSIGFDLLFISSNGYSGVTSSEGVSNYLHYSYKPSGALAWSMGAGTYLGQNVSVGLYYLNLGAHRIEYTSRSYNDGDDVTYNVEKRHLGELALRVGFHF